MSTCKLALAISILSVVGCSQQKYVEAPALPEPDQEAAGESAPEAESPEPAEPADESESTESETAEPESTEPAAPRPPEPARKSCSELPQSTCEVTVGCVWSTTKKCIDE